MPNTILDFWFSDEVEALWFRSTQSFDREIRDKFESLWQQGCNGELSPWEQTPQGSLALVILLDQLPLNMFRDQPQSFITEQASRDVAHRAIEKGFDKQLDNRHKHFLYMPLMHSEELSDQNRSVALLEAAGMTDNLRWAKHHRDIIARFGRFPHRNQILNRKSTSEELEWLKSGGFNP
ncbi:MAG: DUF924 family protein [Pseudomonadota bacterium]|nr:DUF924 family protein [Pseudomonadota bacterium]